ncbi:MAG: Co2+/Mg2+ efflux protein ApaG [Rickettsiaceae bacterium]|nr:MAG: Co2+/Mg2+ efflux protein ApaG [Rickettsiaceae bacterium]
MNNLSNQAKVTVITKFSNEVSNVKQNVYVWLYKIKIDNLGATSFQITDRYWQVFDSNGIYNDIKGKGIVGSQPIIEPYKFFEYTSQVQLFTKHGLMRGYYTATEFINNSQFKIIIPAFSLDENIDIGEGY